MIVLVAQFDGDFPLRRTAADWEIRHDVRLFFVPCTGGTVAVELVDGMSGSAVLDVHVDHVFFLGMGCAQQFRTISGVFVCESRWQVAEVVLKSGGM